jgi:DNA-binding MarR family transcriptional regulator
MSQSDPRVTQILKTCISGRLRCLNRVVTNIYDDELRPFQIKSSQLNILVLAADRGRMLPSEVGEILQIDASTLSRNLDRMRSRGWLEPVPQEDARTQPFRVTKEGRSLLKKIYPAWLRAQQKAESLLGADGAKALIEATGRLMLSESIKA